MKNRKPTYVDIKITEVRNALAQYAEGWRELGREEAEMAAEITAAVELVGGRSEASKIMGVGI